MKLRTILNEILNESKSTFNQMWHGNVVDFNKPQYFSDSKIVASSYGDVSGPYKITLRKPLVLDFSKADGWWLPEESAREQVGKLGMNLEDFDKYRGHAKFRSVKTDHFVAAAKDKGFDGVVFENIEDAGSRPVKGNKYIRTTNVVAINPNSSVKLEIDN